MATIVSTVRYLPLGGPPLGGARNMAIDEALLQHAAQSPKGSRQATLRFYRWRRPTLSLGYFQSISDRRRHTPSRGCDVVRRSTGGGAIVHDREITYSLVAPVEASFVKGSPIFLYRAIHETLVEALAQWGIAARLYAGQDIVKEKWNPQAEPFLCFQRRSDGDVLIAPSSGEPTTAELVKVAGSAQRRRRDVVLQHGSVLLQASGYAPELAGICDLRGMSSDYDLFGAQLIEVWRDKIRRCLRISLAAGGLTEEETALATTLEASKFTQPTWTGKR